MKELTDEELWANAKVKQFNIGGPIWWYISTPTPSGRLIYWPVVDKWMGQAIDENRVCMGYFASEDGAKKCIEKHQCFALKNIPVNSKFKLAEGEVDNDSPYYNIVLIKTNSENDYSITVFNPKDGKLLNFMPTRKVVLIKD